MVERLRRSGALHESLIARLPVRGQKRFDEGEALSLPAIGVLEQLPITWRAPASEGVLSDALQVRAGVDPLEDDGLLSRCESAESRAEQKGILSANARIIEQGAVGEPGVGKSPPRFVHGGKKVQRQSPEHGPAQSLQQIYEPWDVAWCGCGEERCPITDG